jgi:hypothetical protein
VCMSIRHRNRHILAILLSAVSAAGAERNSRLCVSWQIPGCKYIPLPARSGRAGLRVSASWTRLLLVGKPNETGTFASWHSIAASAESDYLMKDLTRLARLHHVKFPDLRRLTECRIAIAEIVSRIVNSHRFGLVPLFRR